LILEKYSDINIYINKENSRGPVSAAPPIITKILAPLLSLEQILSDKDNSVEKTVTEQLFSDL
jgi:hypothetical protein